MLDDNNLHMKNLFVLVLLAITLGCNSAPLKRGSQDDYISKLLEFCDSNKDKHYNDQKSHEGYMAYLKLIAISLNEGPAKGKEFLDKQLKKDPDNDLYKYLKDNWKDFLKCLNDKT